MIDDVATDPITIDDDGAVDATLLGELKRLRESISEERTVDMDIPGYGGVLIGRFKPVPWPEIRKVTEQSTKSRDEFAQLFGQCDLIVKATMGIYARTGSGELKKIADGWSQDLADMFGISANRARTVVREVFKNDLAISMFQNDLVEWMRDSSPDIDQDYQGESRGTTQ